MQPQMVLNLGPTLMPDFVTGALFHSILAWPSVNEVVTFQRVSEELIAGTIRLTKAKDPGLARSAMDQWPQIDWPTIEARAQKPKPARGYLDKRLQHRMAAARAGIGKMHQQLFGIPVILPPGMTALSIDQLCILIKNDVSIDDPENIEKQVWRKSLPILHLAIATQLMLVGKFGSRPKFCSDLQDIEFYRETVQLACLIEQAVHNHPDIAMTSDRMTLVRWFE